MAFEGARRHGDKRGTAKNAKSAKDSADKREKDQRRGKPLISVTLFFAALSICNFAVFAFFAVNNGFLLRRDGRALGEAGL
jgi:hypothetical protein